jgi:hypothetical protein
MVGKMVPIASLEGGFPKIDGPVDLTRRDRLSPKKRHLRGGKKLPPTPFDNVRIPYHESEYGGFVELLAYSPVGID